MFAELENISESCCVFFIIYNLARIFPVGKIRNTTASVETDRISKI
jgi:hypothetical protein